MFIENYDDYGDFETMIISAVVAEQEQNGLNAGKIKYFCCDLWNQCNNERLFKTLF